MCRFPEVVISSDATLFKPYFECLDCRHGKVNLLTEKCSDCEEGLLYMDAQNASCLTNLFAISAII